MTIDVHDGLGSLYSRDEKTLMPSVGTTKYKAKNFLKELYAIQRTPANQSSSLVAAGNKAAQKRLTLANNDNYNFGNAFLLTANSIDVSSRKERLGTSGLATLIHKNQRKDPAKTSTMFSPNN